MPKPAQHAVYNSPIWYMPTSASGWRRIHALIFFAILFPLNFCWAGIWDAPIEQLGSRIATVTGPGAAAFDLSNHSSLARTDVETIRRQIAERLLSAGLRFVKPDQAAATIQVTLSENLQEYVWTATIQQGAVQPTVVIVTTSRASAAVNHDVPMLTIRKTLLWSSDEHILDVSVINGPYPRMVTLFSSQVKVFKLQTDHWVEEQSFPISHTGIWPRDLRGRLFVKPDHSFDAYLPGIACHSNTSSLNCQTSDAPWPVGTAQFGLNAFFAPARNFFTGVVSPAIGKKTTVPAFCSAAPIPRDKYTLWLLAGMDGTVHMLDGISDVASKLSWGSDLATVHSSCGSGWQVLATGTGTGPEDTVQAYELPDREPIAVGQPVEFAGGVTSLWTDTDGDGAVAVARNSETGKNEAYLLTVHCGQ